MLCRSGSPRGTLPARCATALWEAFMRLRLALCIAACLIFMTAPAPPAQAFGPVAFFPDLRPLLRWIWAEEGSDLDPNGRTVPHRPGLGRIWEEEGSSLDPNGRPTPAPSGLGQIWGQVGSSLDPSGRPAPGTPNQVGSDLDPNG